MIFMEPIKQAQTSKNFSDPQFQEGASFSAKCTSQFVSYLLVPSKSPHDLINSYCKTNQPNLMWYAIVLISVSSDNNSQRYGSNLQKETKAISQALIHGIMASLTIPLYGLIGGSYRHKVDLQYLIGFITLLETWWQGYFPYYFWTSNLLTKHDVKAFEDDEETRILLDHSPDMLLVMKWVILVQHALSIAIFNAIRHFLTWHHGVCFSVFHQWPAISFLTQGLLILWSGIVIYLEIHTALILAASIMIISGTPRLERSSSTSLYMPT
ncbi:hypothetical protein ACFX2H_008912 [Malus domestica]